MFLLAHLSDIHFGAEDPAVVEAVRQQIGDSRPNLTVISGDLTQRARPAQFRQAKAFIDSLPGEKLIVPGNHDVPLWNVVARFMFPFSGYCRFVTKDLTPFLATPEVAVVGVNTARSLTRKNGRINEEQVEYVCRVLEAQPPDRIRIVVTHHPFDLAEAYGPKALVGRAAMAMARMATAGVDILLAGHFHDADTGGTARRYPINGYSALVVQAGTATSVRLRGSENSFNLLKIEPPFVTVEILCWNARDRRFSVSECKHYRRVAGGGMERLDLPTPAPAAPLSPQSPAIV